ncbi:hypothetical protein SUGI_0630790 [Cryptomeria japonica]|nr:hypothetical protein SUGI_0630790 [Cryptomeria japonica]
MVKDGLLKDDADWDTLGVKEGEILMMGTTDEIVKAPENKSVFVEDLPDKELVASVGHTAGLFNLGNICFVRQRTKEVELRLASAGQGRGQNPSQVLGQQQESSIVNIRKISDEGTSTDSSMVKNRKSSMVKNRKLVHPIDGGEEQMGGQINLLVDITL